MASKPERKPRTGISATQKIAKPGETKSPDIASEQIKGIPLYLIWTVIKEQIEKKREAVVHIEVQPSMWTTASRFFSICSLMTVQMR